MRILGRELNYRFTIFHRSLLMSLVFVLILVGAMTYLLSDVNKMVESIAGQKSLVESQIQAIEKQTALVKQQQENSKLVALTQSAYSVYSEFLYWSLISATTADDQAVSQSKEAETELNGYLDQIAAINEDMADMADLVSAYLSDFKRDINGAMELTREEAPQRAISSKINSAQGASMTMNSSFEVILEVATNAAAEANQQVGEAGQAVADAADKVRSTGLEVEAHGQELAQQVLIIMAISVFVTILVGVLLSRSITRPIIRLNEVIHSIEQNNDLTRRVSYLRQNEIGDISRAFNAMLEKFSDIVSNINQTSLELQKSSQASAQVSQHTRESADRLSQETDMVATASNEMAATVKGINENTDHATEVAGQARNASESGQQNIDETTRRINELSSAINDSAQSVGSLEKDSQSIGAVLDVIRGIAEQTNLLALNAAIEAARAGDQGRGFAVVADEVRTLAQRTGDSTDEIQAMITQLQNNVRDAVNKMDDSCERAQSTVEQVTQASDSIQRTLEAVTSMKEANQYVSEATREQAVAAENIDRSIVSISELSQSLLSAADQNLASSEQLNTMVDRLQEIVVQFKYN
ncbi:methyl-accepting chemotaxis protein [Hahella ganghwensis]|uniref:methyl-accepting chemotaxis protein n=1 Tax=Hahella ganghwensis TaxID=286420 RepID=UPI00036F4EB4|nr:methyl-accepting chemotaxis protein [Hahella ganghwensis]